MAEELVARGGDEPAILDRRQVDVAPAARDALPVGHGLAVNPEPGHATVRVNLEAQVREALAGGDADVVLRIAA